LSERPQAGAFQSGGEFAMAAGPVTARLREQLLDIQRGRVADPHGWVHIVA